ncbi:MAG: helix-turn-helix domain-containing protein, partial [Chitinophagaceae bacterium]
VWFDVNMLDKILFNLLSNAVKYTAEYGFIHVVINRTEGEMVSVRVEDSGVGMEPETMEHAFDLFYQGEDGRNKGTGLGLALSKELILLHHGSITIQSEKGRGATFEIRLPLGRDHFTEEELAKDMIFYEPNYEEARIFLQEDAAPKDLVGEAAVALHEQSILVIEDNAEIRAFIRRHLEGNYEIIEAPDGDTGIELAFERMPDLVISDVLMPGKKGFEVTEIIKNDLRTSHIPVIILTARGSMEQQIAGLKTNADAYIVKPFHAGFLEQTIRGLLANRATLRGHYSSELPTSGGGLPVDKKTERKFISRFTAIVEDNISNDQFTVNDICTALGMSRVPLYKKVKAVMGYNVNEYILHVRLQKARHLLLHEDLSIAEISFQVGFSSPTYFATVFKSRFGVTPKSFKQKGRTG